MLCKSLLLVLIVHNEIDQRMSEFGGFWSSYSGEQYRKISLNKQTCDAVNMMFNNFLDTNGLKRRKHIIVWFVSVSKMPVSHSWVPV